MIKTVKNTVLDRLRQKRFSADSQLQQSSRLDDLSPSNNMKEYMKAKKDQEEQEMLLQRQIDLIEMLERFEDSHPGAYSVFMEEAKKRGIYKATSFRRSGRGSLDSSSQSQYYNQSPQSTQQIKSQLKQEKDKQQQTQRNSKYNKYIIQHIDDKLTTGQKYEYYMNKLNNEEQEQQQNRLISSLQVSKKLQSSSQTPKHQNSEQIVAMSTQGSFKKKNQQPHFAITLEQSLPKHSNDLDKKYPFIDSLKNDTQRKEGIQIENELMMDDQSTPKVNHQKRKSISKFREMSKLYSNKKKTGNSTFALSEYQRLPQVTDKPTLNLSANKYMSIINPFNDGKKKTIDPFNAPTLNVSNFDENILTRRTMMVQKLPKLSVLLDKNDKFNDFFRRLCTSSTTSTQSQNQNFNANKSKENSQSRQEKQMALQSQQNFYSNQVIGQQVLKNLRLSKQSIKAHISKRYGKSFTDKIMQILESYNKSMHNIGIDGYIELIGFCFFSIQPTQISGMIFQVPNIYKLLFQIIDIGNKGFICEHDLFQIIWSLSNDKINTPAPSQLEDTSGVSQRTKGISSSNVHQNPTYYDGEQINLSINYRDQVPQVRRSVILECFYSDFSLISREIEKIHTFQQTKNETASGLTLGSQLGSAVKKGSFRIKKGALQLQKASQNILPELDDDNTSNNTASIKQQRKQPRISTNCKLQAQSLNVSPRIGTQLKQSGSKSVTKKIFDAIQQHAISSLDSADTVPSKAQQSNQVMNQSISPHISAFSHFNPVTQMIKEKKQKSIINHNFDSEEPCKQLTFEQFIRLQFENEIPQFIEDFFQHMTTLSFRDLARKQLGITYNQLPIINKMMKKKTSSQQISLGDNEDGNLQRRNLQLLKLNQFYDKDTIKILTNGFRVLSQNYQTEKNKLNIFLTQSSIVENFKKVFRYFNESMALRFYNLLSEGINMKRIYLPQYLLALIPLIKGNLAEKHHFIFRLLDGDNDGQLQSQDISDILNNVLVCPVQNEIKVCTCPLYKETHALYKQYVTNNLLTYKVKKLVIDYKYFFTQVKHSCLINEFIDKLLMQQNRPSIFSHDPKDLQKNKVIHDMDIVEFEKEFNVLKIKGLAITCQQAIDRVEVLKEQVFNIRSTPLLNEGDNDEEESGGGDLLLENNYQILIRNKQVGATNDIQQIIEENELVTDN